MEDIETVQPIDPKAIDTIKQAKSIAEMRKLIQANKLPAVSVEDPRLVDVCFEPEPHNLFFYSTLEYE